MTSVRRSPGRQILWSLSQTFTLFEPSDTFPREIAALIGIGAAWKVPALTSTLTSVSPAFDRREAIAPIRIGAARRVPCTKGTARF